MLQNKKIEIRELRDKRNELCRKLEQKETEVYRLATENDELAKELDLRETEAERLRNGNWTAGTELRDKETEIRHLLDVRNLLDSEMRSKEQDAALISVGNKELGIELQKKEAYLGRAKEENRLLRQKLREMDADLLSSTHKNTEIVELLNCSKRGELSCGGEGGSIWGDMEGKLRYDNTVLAETVEGKLSVIRALTEENSRLREDLHEKRKEEERLRDENIRLDRALKEKGPQLETVTDENILLRRIFEEKEKHIERLTEENVRYERELEGKKRQSDILASRNAQLKEEYREKRLQGENLSDEHTRLEKALQEATSQAGRLRAEIARTEKELRGKKSEVDSLQREEARPGRLPRGNSTEAEADGARGPHTAHMTGRDGCMSREVHVLAGEGDRLERQLQEQTQGTKRLSTVMQEEETDMGRLTTANACLSDDIQGQQAQARKLAEENRHIRKVLQDTAQELQRLTEENRRLSKEQQDTAQELQRLTEENRRISKEQQDNEAESMTITRRQTHYCEALQEKEQEIGMLTEKKACHATRDTNRNLRHQLQEKTVIVENMRKEKAELENKLINIEEEINVVMRKTRDLEKELVSREETLESLRETYAICEDEMQARTTELQRLTERVGAPKEGKQVQTTLQEKHSEMKELRGKYVQLMGKRRVRSDEEQNESLRNVSETRTRKFDTQLMRKIKEFQVPRYEATDFGINLKKKVEELMDFAERKRVAEEELLAKQAELQKFIDDNEGFIKGTETKKSITSFKAQNAGVYRGKQNKNTNVGSKKYDNDLEQEFRNEFAVFEIPNCHTKGRKAPQLINVRTGIRPDTGQTETGSTPAGSEMHEDSRGVQHPTAATTRRGEANFLPRPTADSTDVDTELQLKRASTGLMQGDSKRSGSITERAQSCEGKAFPQQLKPHFVGDLKRLHRVLRHVSRDTGFDSVTDKRNVMMAAEEGTGADRNFIKHESMDRTEGRIVTDGSTGRLVL
jgi:chromosome segregation ATPase